jgi:hypothetical protein
MSNAFISKNNLVIRSSGGGPQVSTRLRSPAIQASRIRLRQRCGGDEKRPTV